MSLQWPFIQNHITETFLFLASSIIIHGNLWFQFPLGFCNLWFSFCTISKRVMEMKNKAFFCFSLECLQMSRCYWTIRQPTHLNVTFYVNATTTLGLSDGLLTSHLCGWIKRRHFQLLSSRTRQEKRFDLWLFCKFILSFLEQYV